MLSTTNRREILPEDNFLPSPYIDMYGPPATINLYKFIHIYINPIGLYCGIFHKTPSCFIASAFAAPRSKLLTFDITLHRLKFPSSDRYMLRFS